MPAGGSASKIGLRYEEWWTVFQMLEVLAGRATSIRIEDPNFEKSEFTLVVAGRTELHQTKISNPNGKWSLALLDGKQLDLLPTLLRYLEDPKRDFRFISGSDAPELRVLSQLARDFCTFEEFEAQLGKGHTGSFQRICASDENLSAAEVHDRLRRVFVGTIDELTLRRHVRLQVSTLFLGDADTIEGELLRLAKDRLFETLTAPDLMAHLAAKGYRPREVVGAEEAGFAVRCRTEEYVADIRRKLIGKSLIERSFPSELVDKVRSIKQSRTFAITGAAGAGKSAAMLQLVQRLVAESIPTLAFRLDRIPPERSDRSLGQRLGLDDSPAHLLAAVAGEETAVLVIDQLDAVSTVSGRNSALFDAVAALLEEVECMRLRKTIHVVLACRGFDWENDHRLRRLLSENDERLELGDFSDAEVDTVLAKTMVDRRVLTAGQAELLRNPQNLSLFYETREVWKRSPKFVSVKDLFDAYWDEKRRTVGERTRPIEDCWSGVVRKLVKRMSESQQLSAPREALDEFRPDYVAQLVSEGVLARDGGRVSFGHESFFDYCYARGFIDSGKKLVEEIERGKQKLFLRAQVRQVLDYLREADPSRYLQELECLIFSPKVRPHLKDLTLSLVFRQSDVREGERDLLFPVVDRFVKSPLEERVRQRVEDLVWRHFFSSSTWFTDPTVQESLRQWLESDEEAVLDLVVQLLRRHQKDHGDTVANLIEPYLDAGAGWKDRFVWLMSWADLEGSRRFFEVFLKLVDRGDFDDKEEGEPQGRGFWTMFHGLGASRPAWLSELVSHWLRRNLKRFEPEIEEPRLEKLFGGSQAAGKEFLDAAQGDPASFLHYVLPEAIKIAEVFSQVDDERPRRDSVFWNFFDDETVSAEGALRTALVNALKAVGATDPNSTDATRIELRKRTTYFSNTLLLELYGSCGATLADEAADLFCDQPWRFQCGYADSSYWIARNTLGAIAPHCSLQRFANLEETAIKYVSDYERSPAGYRISGSASYSLLSALPRESLSDSGLRRLGELVRKFGKREHQPRGFRGGTIGSPINDKALDRMTDHQWLRAIQTYQGEERNWEKLTGGAWELASKLKDKTKEDPDRFGRLLFQLAEVTNPCYVDQVVSGLAETDCDEGLKLEVARHVFTNHPKNCGANLARLLSGIEILLADEFTEMLAWIATEHPDPERERWKEKALGGKSYYGGSIYSHGFNTARGIAMESIANLLWRDRSYSEVFRPVLIDAAKDPSKAVRCCAVDALRALAYHDPDDALEIFSELVGLDPELLGTEPCQNMIYRGIPEHFEQVRPYIECLLRAETEEAGKLGGCLSFMAVLWEHSAEDLVEEAMAGAPRSRLGVCEVASRNLGQSPCKKQCDKKLRAFFEDECEEVRQQAADCFRQIRDRPIEDFEDLIFAFCDSEAFAENAHSLFYTLEKSNDRIARIALMVCRKFLDRFCQEDSHLPTNRAADTRTISTLLFRAYQQGDEQISIEALDLIDHLVISGIYDVNRGFEDFER